MKVLRLIIGWTLHLIQKESKQKDHEDPNALHQSCG